MNVILKILFKFRAKYYAKHLFPYLKGTDKVLDIGAGSGFISEHLAEKCSMELVDVKDYNQTSLPLKIFDGEHLPYRNSSFDKCILVTVLHHASLPRQIKLLKEAKRVGKKVIIIEALYYNSIQSVWLKFYDLFLNFIAGVPVKWTFHDDKTWKQLFGKVGLKLKSEKEFPGAIGLIKLKLYELA